MIDMMLLPTSHTVCWSLESSSSHLFLAHTESSLQSSYARCSVLVYGWGAWQPEQPPCSESLQRDHPFTPASSQTEEKLEKIRGR